MSAKNNDGGSFYFMPSLGADMVDGTVLVWLVQLGDTVHRGDIVATIDTDKAEIDAEIFQDGQIAEFLVPVGERVPVGTPLARLVPIGASTTAASSRAPSTESPAAVADDTVQPEDEVPTAASLSDSSGSGHAQPAPGVPHHPLTYSPLVRKAATESGLTLAQVPAHGPGGRVTRDDVETAARHRRDPAKGPVVVRASPKARRLAEELGLSLASVVGTGPSGAVLAIDVHPQRQLAPPQATSPQSPPQQVETPSGKKTNRKLTTRRAIAELMSRSKRDIPHYYLSQDVSFAACSAWLGETNADRPALRRILPAALILKATALAVCDVPVLNGFWIGDAFQPAASVNLGVAIAQRGGGLMAPCIHNTDTLTIDELMNQLRDLVTRTRSGGLRSSEMSDATLTVTNLGDQGVQSVFGVIYPPQVAMLGVGSIGERAWAQDGMVGARSVVTMTLSGDHRATDGHEGARLLRRINELLQLPTSL